MYRFNSLGTCKTTFDDLNPNKGFDCVFPFEYKGLTYNGCGLERGNKYWCSTKGMMYILLQQNDILILDSLKSSKYSSGCQWTSCTWKLGIL